MAIRVLTIDRNGSQCVMVGQCFNLRLWFLDSYSLAFIFFLCSSAFSCAVNLIFCFVVVFFFFLVFWFFV